MKGPPRKGARRGAPPRKKKGGAGLVRGVRLKNRLGLHARAAAQFVQLANRFQAHIWVQKDSARVNAKSIMGLLTLGATVGSRLTIEAGGGPDAAEALVALETLVQNRFGEPE